MARLFNATTDSLVCGTVTLPLTAGTLMFRFYPTFAQADGVQRAWFGQWNAGFTRAFDCEKLATNALSLGWLGVADTRIAVASASYTMNTNMWNDMVIAWSGAVTTAYLNGVSIGSAGLSTTDLTGRNRTIGNIQGFPLNASSRMADFAVLSQALLLGQVQRYHAGVPANLIVPQAVEMYLPITGTALELTLAFSGARTQATIAGTTRAPDPWMLMQAARRRAVRKVVAASGSGPLIFGGQLLRSALLRGGRLVG